MPEFKGTADLAWQGWQKVCEQSFIAPQRGRKLKQYRPHPSGRPQRIHRLEENVGELRSFQPLDMCNAHVRLQWENESRRCRFHPVLQRRWRGQPPESIVDLNGVQAPRIV